METEEKFKIDFFSNNSTSTDNVKADEEEITITKNESINIVSIINWITSNPKKMKLIMTFIVAFSLVGFFYVLTMCIFYWKYSLVFIPLSVISYKAISSTTFLIKRIKNIYKNKLKK